MDGVGLHPEEELTPWRRTQFVRETHKMSVQGTQTMKKFDQETQRIIDHRGKRKVFSESEWQDLMRIYKQLWPFKGPRPEALDWWTLTTTELVQAVPWHIMLSFLFNKLVLRMRNQKNQRNQMHPFFEPHNIRCCKLS